MRGGRVVRAGLGALGMLLAAGCASEERGARSAESAAAVAPAASPDSTAVSPPASADWRPLIDATMSAWRGYRSDTLPSGWRVVDGALTKDGPIHDILSRDQFGDFELEFDWKLSPGGNAGVFYRASEEYDAVYWSGVEYQLLDDAKHPDGKDPLTSAGAVYGLYPTPRGLVKPAGEWNRARIVARGTRVGHWLNGTKVAEYDTSSPEWGAKVKASKFAKWPGFAKAARGHLAIQGDHDGTLTIRDLRVRDLTGVQP